MVRVRGLAVVVALVAVAVAVGCGPSSSSSFELCGGWFEVADGFEAVDFGDRYGEKVGRSFSILPTGDQPQPATLLDVVTPPDGFAVESEAEVFGPNDVDLGRFTSPDGGCWVSIYVSSNSLETGSLDVGWVATAGEGP
jgi:hypothetical protein